MIPPCLDGACTVIIHFTVPKEFSFPLRIEFFGKIRHEWFMIPPCLDGSAVISPFAVLEEFSFTDGVLLPKLGMKSS